MTQAEMDELETLVNRRVQQDDPIRCWFPNEEELKKLPLRKRPTVSEHVRVVAMGDYEMVACGGTHPSTTGQIGPIKIISSTPARGKMRLCFVSGMRAIKYLQKAAQCAAQVSQALSAGFDTALDALQKEREAAQALRREMNLRLTQAALQTLRAGKQGSVYAGHLEFADHETLLHAAAALTKEPGAIVLLSCPHKASRMLVFARGAEAKIDMSALMRACGGRGGGKPDMAKGSAADETVLEKAVGEVMIR